MSRLAVAALAAFALAAPLLAQAVTADDVHRAERQSFGIGELRRGASGNPQDADAANTDEAKAGGEAVPDLFVRRGVETADTWPARRAEIARLVEDNWTGRIPETVSQFRIVWTKSSAPSRAGSSRGAVTEQWAGLIITPDGRSGPVIDATITFPARARQAPALIDYTYIWPANFNAAALAGNGPRPPDSVQLALDRGFAHVAYRPQLLQADTGATMRQGVIGLARWPRERHDWGALRAWGWGASELRKELARDPRIDGKRVSLTGHSRFGKGVLVAAAFDHEFADAHVSSSGAGGAKLMRRNFGETWENLAGSGEFHWFTPNIMTYAEPGKTVADLPVDAHMLIALRAPRPLFVTSGTAEQGDSWVDPKGMWIATRLAAPAWELFGERAAKGETMPAPGDTREASYGLAWYQHRLGHVPWPAFPAFYDHEERFSKAGRWP